MSDNVRVRPDSFVVTSRPRPQRDLGENARSTYVIQLTDRKVHVTERASLRRAVAAAMKDRRPFE